jgi:hypothetical protein
MPVKDSEMIPPGTINHVDITLFFDEPVLDEGPPHCIKRSLGHIAELFDTLFVSLV